MEKGDSIENDMVRHLLESIPLEEYDGRSPKEIHYLVYEPFCENSPLSLSKDVPEDVLLKIPMYNLIFFFLSLINENQPVKLISKGKLPSKIVNPVFSQHFIKEDLDKIDIGFNQREILQDFLNKK